MTALLDRLAFWRSKQPAAESAADDPAPKVSAQSAAQAERFRKAIDNIRRNASASAKAFTTLGSAALTALAINKFADIFPLPSEDFSVVVAAVVAIVGFFAVAYAIARFTGRLWRVDAPVSMSPSKKQVEQDAEEFDSEAVAKALHGFDETARLNGAPSLEAYAARGRRLERIARQRAVDDPHRQALLDQADEIHADVDATMAHVAADVVRTRSRNVVSGRAVVGVAVLFVSGLASIAVAADYLEGERSGRVALLTACAQMGKALSEQLIVKQGKPSVCDHLMTGEKDAKDQKESTNARLIAEASTCASTVKALAETGLDTTKLTATDGPCPGAGTQATRDAIVSATLPALLQSAATCEQTSGTESCQPIHDMVKEAKRIIASKGKK